MNNRKNASTPQAAFMDRIWDFFASVRLSVVLLLSLAVTSIIGTVIPQNADPSVYARKFGPDLYSVLDALSIFNMYQSWWFRLLLCLLVINLVVCSVRRLKATWKVIFPKKTHFNPDRFKKAAGRIEWQVPDTPAGDLKDVIEQYMQKRYSHVQTRQENDSWWIFGERGRWTRLGVYGVHLSVVLLVIGGLIGSLFGFEGMMNVPEGETRRTITLRNSDETRQLDFSVRCDDFAVSHYPSGRPKEYRSDIAIVENEKEVETHRLRVNDPLRYKGINIFQSSYGQNAAEKFTVVFTDTESGMRFEKQGAMGETVDLPAGKGELTVEDFSGNFAFRGHNVGPAFLASLNTSSGEQRPVLLPVNYPKFDRMREGDYAISIEDVEYTYYTGLQVTRDPGVPLVYISFALMILACYVTFFMFQQKIGIEVQDSDAGVRVAVGGISERKRPGIKTAVRRLAAKLQKQTNQRTTG
ncbi:MAG: cytochrome c biogenesis protein ResB [Desulfosalsimonas sp.]|uniref:cytochrome c biogenesis protein ResB n=1 Tax=Desulfosalsimonas sp. TaxID=3073848 RepID=UPI0039710F25